jgi:hypothetical protein
MLTGNTEYGNIRFNYITAPFESTARCGVRDEQTVFVSVFCRKHFAKQGESDISRVQTQNSGTKPQGLTYRVFVS